TAMSQQSMYGRNMGIGFVEVLSHSYDIDASGSWRYANEFDYKNSSVDSTISTIWQKTYNTIANINILIRNINEADPTMFTDNNYDMYRGEAYGLRGFLHLDLMRLFACAPSMDPNAKGVPYVTEYSTEVVGQKTVKETMQMVIDDLTKAREYLSSDSLKTSSSRYSHRYSRVPYFNYYAATLSLARAYLWNGDKENALKYANEIIEDSEDNGNLPFSWIHYTNMQQTNRNELDMTFSSEHIFQLKMNNWEDIANYYFTSKAGSDALTPSDETAQDIYEVASGYGNDYRYLKCYEQDGEKRFMCKFWHMEGGRYNDIYPLLRMTEAYYIAAECQKDSNPKRAIELLNIVRENRNLSLFPLPETLTADEIQNEIYKEYRKEFVGEAGQLFFYYKRLNASSIKGASVVPRKSVYVLPIPSNDVEFGGYIN
ncbi:MAG: RagB/SusD family nutrient uptake outer membrane protein, partial [Prevotella sp.]|nr:RagB/SusD family nutrient uptake outer membrane protein [Prevotella sp.]